MKKRTIAVILACALLVTVFSACAPLGTTFSTGKNSAFVLPEKKDRSTMPRVIVTTDLEVDDINGVILSLLYSNEYDIAGLVWTAGMYHFTGDGEHTLAEITPNYANQVVNADGTVENAGQLTSFRPPEPGLIKRLVDVNYRHDYEFLSQNDSNYPTPDELLAVVKEGNVEFEGDYREETEGSEWIKQCILDDDPRPLYIEHWGGINTTVRALLSIYEEYHETDQWADIQDKVVNKICIDGGGEDNCRADSKIDELFPGLQSSDRNSVFSYMDFPLFHDDAALDHYYEGGYLAENIKFNHGDLLHEFHLMGDGQVIYGEPYVYQYGLVNYMDWGVLWDLGYSNQEFLQGLREDYEQYHWMACQYSGGKYIDFGIDQTIDRSDTRYKAVFHDELAARADWASKPADQCNHAPVVTAENTDIAAKAGEVVNLAALSATDPDGDELSISWWVHDQACIYQGKAYPQADPFAPLAEAEDTETLVYPTVTGNGLNAKITVPADAQSGDRFVVNMQVQDDAAKPMTRFAQFVITVEG